MSFLNPAGLILLLLIPLLILLHLFRAARREVDVAELRFWITGTEELTRSTRLHRRVLWTPSLLLQLLAAALVSLAIADPVISVRGQGWPRSILLVDNSASMRATDVAGDRFAALRAEAELFIGKLKPGQEAMIIEVGRHPSVKVPFTHDPKRLSSGLREIGIFAGVANIADALGLAAALANNGPPTDIHLFTDAAYAPPPLPSGSSSLVWHVVGRGSDNVGITAFQIRANVASGIGYEAFIKLSNVSETPKDFRLRVVLDDRVLYDESIAMAAKLERSYIVPFEKRGAGAVRAEIDLDDDLGLDDVAYSVLPNPRSRRILLITDGNFFLENALRADPNLDVVSIRPQQYSPKMAKADVVVLDRVSMPDLPPGNYLLIQSLPGDVPLTATRDVDFPAVVDWDRQHPIGRHLDLSNLVIRKAVGVQPNGDCAALVEAQEIPLITACIDKGRRLVFVGFDLLQSELPLRAALPILVTNIIDWLSPASLENRAQHLRAGERFTAQVDPSVTAAEVRLPDGSSDVVEVKDGIIAFDNTLQAGLYTLELSSDQRNFAVNLLSREETNILPRRGMETTPHVPEPHFSYSRELWWYLALLALLTMVVEITLVVRSHSTPVPWPSLLLRGVALVSLAAALARPTLATETDITTVAFLIDMSDSIAPAAWEDAGRAVEAAIAEKGKHDKIEVIAFAGHAKRIEVPATSNRDGQLSNLIDTQSTNIAGAISFALASLPKDGGRRIVLLSDGNENRRSAAEVAALASREHTAIYTVPMRELGGPEITLKSVLLPLEVHLGEPFSAKVVLWSRTTPEAKLELLRDGTIMASGKVFLKDGENVFTYRDASDKEGVHVYEARIATAAGEAEEQGTAKSALTVRGRPRLLYVDGELRRAKNLIQALSQQRFAIDSVSADAFPAVSENLAQYDAVILSNAPAWSLSDEGLARLHRYVTEDGGGLLMLGGDRSFGPGGFGETPLEEILPVQMMPRAKVEDPSQALVYVIDRSGSMSTEQGEHSRLDLAKQAAQQSIRLLNEKTAVGVLVFDTEADWVVPLQAAKDKDLMIRDIATVEAGGGGTELLSAIEEAHRVLRGRKAMLKHIIVLSDGEAPGKNFKELLDEIAEDQITVSSIAISSEAGQDLLEKVARWGTGRYYFTNDLYAIPRILTGETQLAGNRSIIEETFRPTVGSKSSEILKGVEWQRTPALHGYVATTSKPLAEILLVSPHDDPVLAVWQSGPGRTAAFTSDANGRWGKDWVSWGDFGKFFGQLVRWTLRPRTDYIVSQLSFDDQQGRLSIDVTDESGRYINFLDGQAGVVKPDKSRVVAPLTQSAPGRYEASFPAEAPGVYLVGISLKDSDNRLFESRLSVGTVPNVVERQEVAVNRPMLLRLAELSGGRMLSSPAEVFSIGGRSATHLQLRPWLMLAGLLAMIADLVLRRVLAQQPRQRTRTPKND